MLRILTLNIWNNEGDYNNRKKLIREWITRLSPDIIALQEVLKGPEIDQLKDLFEDTEYEYTLYAEAVKLSDSPETGFGNAIVSRWKITKPEKLLLPMPITGDQRVALSAEIDTPWGKLLFISTHLDKRLDGSFVREHQVCAISDMIRSQITELSLPPVLCGDFNAEPDSSEIRFLMGLQPIGEKSECLFEAWKIAGKGDGITWSNKNTNAAQIHEPDRRLDYIFVGPARETGFGFPINCTIVCNEEKYNTWSSDHFGLFAELQTGEKV